MEYLVIDGYNVINAWRQVFDLQRESLEDCRQKLLDMLSNYQGYKKINIIVVFDAHLLKGSQLKTEQYDHITVVYTKEHQTADHFIERFVYETPSKYKVRVVTSDYLEQTMVLSNGGVRVTPRELLHEIRTVEKQEKQRKQMTPVQGNSIQSHLHPDLAEKLEKMRRGKF